VEDLPGSSAGLTREGRAMRKHFSARVAKSMYPPGLERTPRRTQREPSRHFRRTLVITTNEGVTMGLRDHP
jgi:hypothetical protein